MTIRSLNHAVLYVTDVALSADFYCAALGFERIPVDFSGVAFLRGTASANDHDLGLFQARGPRPPQGSVGLYHLAWEVPTLNDFANAHQRLSDLGALTGASNHAATKALYGADPDGIEFEITWLVPDHLVMQELVPGVPPTRPLDLDAEIERYGGNTLGGPRTDRDVMMRALARLTEPG